MADEPTLPALPTGPAMKTFVSRSSPRKQSRFRNSAYISSDPPLFSSDDDPGVENYEHGARETKRRYRGPWHSQQPVITSSETEEHAKRRKLRFADSGVYMGSDPTDDDSDLEFLKANPARNNLSFALRPSPLKTTVVHREKTAEDQAKDKITLCLETGNSNIDLSCMNLTRISSDTIKPLNSLIGPSPSFLSYDVFEPKLELYLGNNSLRQIPGRMFHLEHLTVLSLRNNQIKEIPQAMGRAINLEQLNIALNGLRWLPYEMLTLLRVPRIITSIHRSPNSFVEPLQSSKQSSKLIENIIKGTNVGLAVRGFPQKVYYLGRSHVRFMDVEGKLMKGPELPTVHDERGEQFSKKDDSRLIMRFIGGVDMAPPDNGPNPPGNRPASYAPSIHEMATKKWLAASRAEQEARTEHDNLKNMLFKAREVYEMEDALRQCTVCQKEFAIARTEWIEWWIIAINDIDSGETTMDPRDAIEDRVPLMRRGCSWRCVPSREQ